MEERLRTMSPMSTANAMRTGLLLAALFAFAPRGHAEEPETRTLRDAVAMQTLMLEGRTTWTARIDVPAGTVALHVGACADTDIDLYLRFGEPVKDDFAAEADAVSRGDSFREIVRLTPTSTVPIKPGAWFVTVQNRTPSRSANVEIVAMLDAEDGAVSVFPGNEAVVAPRDDAKSIALRSFLPQRARSLIVEIDEITDERFAYALEGPGGYLRRGRGPKHIVLMRGESPPGTYTLSVKATDGAALPSRLRVRASWDYGRGAALPQVAEPVLRESTPVVVTLGGESNPVIRRVRVPVAPRTRGFEIQAENSAGADIDLYIRRGGRPQKGDEDADYFALSSAPRERLVVGGAMPLKSGTYFCEVVLVDGCGPVAVTLRMRTIAAKPGRGTWGEKEPPLLAPGAWVRGTVKSGLVGVTWYSIRVPAKTKSMHAMLLNATAPLDLVVARWTDGSVMRRGLSPRVDERIDHTFARPPDTPRRFVLGVLNRGAHRDEVRYRLALSFNGPPALPKDLVWPPVMSLEGLNDRERVAAATVELTVAGDAGGSGACVSPRGLILTCRHVLDPRRRDGMIQRRRILVAFPTRLDAPPTQAFFARVVEEDKAKDLALLELTTDVFERKIPRGLALPWVRMGASAGLHLGDPLWVLGYPAEGSDRSRTPVILTRGSVAGLERKNSALRWIKTDAWIGMGHSGGSVIDAQARLIGVAAATLGNNEVLGVAIPVSVVPDAWKARIRREVE